MKIKKNRGVFFPPTVKLVKKKKKKSCNYKGRRNLKDLPDQLFHLIGKETAYKKGKATCPKLQKIKDTIRITT